MTTTLIWYPWTLKQMRKKCTDHTSRGNHYFIEKDVKSGVGVYRWREKISNLHNASSDYTRTRETTTAPRCKLGYKFEHRDCGTWEEVFEYNHIPDVSLAAPPTFSSNVLNGARSAFLSNAVDAASPLKGQVLLGELKETLRMIKNPASALRDLASSQMRKHKSASKASAETWLEWSFGWLPFMADIGNAIKIYDRVLNNIEVVHASGKDSDETYQSVSIDSSKYLHANYFFVKQVTKLFYEYTARCGGAFKVRMTGGSASTVNSISQASGMSWKEIPFTLWELTPWSFLIDYFSNIGEILNGWHASDLDWIYTYTTQKRSGVVVQSRSIVKNKFDHLYGYTDSSPTARKENYVFSRTSGVDMSLPNLHASLPPLGMKYGNMLALIAAKRPW
jgi:hypothetical protein